MAASYSAVIDLRVNGLNSLKTVEQRTAAIENITKRIKPIPTLFTATNNKSIQDAKNELSKLLKAYADGNTRAAKFSTSIAGLNLQIGQFKTVAANAKTGSDQFTNALAAAANASARLLDQELERFSTLQSLYQRSQAPGMTATLLEQGPSRRVKELLGKTKKVTAPGSDPSIAMLDLLQSELVETRRLVGMTSQEFEELSQAINKVDVALGKTKFGPEDTLKGIRRRERDAAKDRTRRRESMALGAGFPLLMGGGPAQVTGALIGSQFGPGFGGQILGAAVAQQLQDAVARVADLQAAINELNMDKVRDSVLLVNQELSNQVALLKESGQKTQAQAVLAQAVYEQFGLGAKASSLIKERADAVKNAWDKVVGTVSALLALLAQPFIAVLVPILNFVQLVVKGWTEIFNLIAKVTNLPGLDKFLGLQGTDEAAGGRGAAMQARARAIEKETELLQKTLKLEKQRRIGSSFDDKLANAKIDAQLKLNELRAKYRDDLLQTEGEERKALREKLAVEEQILKTKHGQQVARMKAEEAEKQATAQIKARSILENGQIQLAQKRLDIQNSVASAELSAQLAINGLLLQRATNNKDITKQVQLQVDRANLIYKQTVLQVQQEANKAKLATLSAQVKLKELQATIALKEAKGEANAADYAAVKLQGEALRLTMAGAKAAEQIAASQLKGANAVRQAAIEQAKFNAFSQLKAMNERAISQMPGQGGSGGGQVSRAQAAQNYIRSMQGRQFTSIGLNRYLQSRGYAEGGYVTRPTSALIGEAGESEYVIPASKMNRAMQRYSAGVRGEAVTAGAVGAGSTTNANYSSQQNMYYGGGGTSVNITTGPVIRMNNRDYVAMSDLQRGMSTAVGAAESNMMGRMSRSYSTRRSMGL